MGRKASTASMITLALAFAVLATAASAQVIDFETLPGGAPTGDQQLISNQYAPYGVTFELLDRTTHLPIGAPRIAKVGAPLTAFEGCLAVDTPHAHLGLGQSFLTDGTSLGVEGDLRITYSTPVLFASGVILDVDCRVDGGAPCEQWTITAHDGSGAVVGTVVLDGPAGPPNAGCLSPANGPGDSDAMGWTLGGAGVLISSIEIRYTGSATNVGLAFDQFSVATQPEPVTVTASASTDTICAGEHVTLSPVAAFGFAPYDFQWQEEPGAGRLERPRHGGRPGRQPGRHHALPCHRHRCRRGQRDQCPGHRRDGGRRSLVRGGPARQPQRGSERGALRFRQRPSRSTLRFGQRWPERGRRPRL
ncbi:MAG: hypothetical protein IPK64_17690 [bacterium]|nr:hypothetical protein [bacterium]